MRGELLRLKFLTIMSFYFFFFNDTATTEIYTLSLHDALPISARSHYAVPSCPAVSRNLAWGFALPSRGVSPRRMSKRSLHLASRISQSRPQGPVPGETATVSCSRPRAESTRHNLRADPGYAPLRYPHPAAPALPHALGSLLARPEFQSSLHSLRISFVPGRIYLPNLLPAARRQHILLFHLPDIEAAHGFAQLFVRFEHHLGVLEMGRCFHYGLRPHLGIAGLKDARSDEHCFRAQSPHQRCVCRSGNAARRKIRHRQLAGFGDLANQFERRAQLFGFAHQLVVAHGGQLLHLADDRAHVPHGFHHVSRARFALGANHRRAFRDAPQRFTEIA